MEMIIRGTDGPDELMGTTQDTLVGGAGDDTLDATAGGGGNRLFGQDGDDLLKAGSNDILVGGAGDDMLFVGSGRAQLVGGAGADGFWIVDGELPEQVNVVRDFEQGTDVLGLRGLSMEALRSLRVSQVNETDTLVQVEGQNVALLRNTVARTLSRDDFFVAGEPEPPPPPEPGDSLLDEILDRGFLKVAVTGQSVGFDFLEEDGEFSGLTVDMSRAVATALFADDDDSDEFDPDDFIEYVVVDFEDGFGAVASKEVDLGAITATQNTTRDGTLGVDYSPIIFYDTQAVLVPADSGITSLPDLEGLTIGVVEGFVDGPNLLDALSFAGIEANIELLPDQDGLFAAYDAGDLEAISLDKGVLVDRIPTLSEPDNQLILDEVISEEPFGLLVPENESEFADVVRWSVYATSQAEEFGITSENVEDFLDSGNSQIQRFLGQEGRLGEALGIDNDFTLDIISEVGNYGEIYARHFDENLLPRGQNALWNAGGRIYPLSFVAQEELDFELIDNDDRNVLEEVKERGFLRFGIEAESLGDDIENTLGFVGFDAEYGKAIAAAIFGDPNAVEFVPVDGLGFAEVANGEVDILGAQVHDLGRDASLGVDFGPIFIYENQVIVSAREDINSLEELDGGTIGVLAGTFFEESIEIFLETIDADIELVRFNTVDEAVSNTGQVDAITGDNVFLNSFLASVQASAPPDAVIPAEGTVLAGGVSKAPFALVVDENQSQWKDIVSTVAHATLQAVGFGMNSENVDLFLDSPNPVIQRFLGVEGTIGEVLGLSNDFVQDVITSSGNVLEIFERHFPGSISDPQPLPDGSPNAGNLLFSIPFDQLTR